MFDLRHVAALFSPDGYTYPETRAGITCSADGQCYVKDENGPEVPWSGETVKLDATAPFTSFYNSLTKTPDFSEIKPLTPQFVAGSLTSLANGINTDFNPFVLGTQCTVCAPFVPNPENKPIPGPVFTDPGTSSATTTLAADQKTATPETTTDEKADTKAETTTDEKADEKADAPAEAKTPATDEATSDGADSPSTTSGPKHRKPTATSTAIKQVRDSINASVSKVSDSFSKKSKTTDSSSSKSTSKSSGSGEGGSQD